jgi:hypothetical protein
MPLKAVTYKNMQPVKIFYVVVWLLLAVIIPTKSHAGIPSTHDGNPVPLAMRVTEANFGIVLIDSDGKIELKSTRIVPLRPGLSFFWSIRIDQKNQPITWREELILPKKPQTWNAQRVSSDGQTAYSRYDLQNFGGFLSNMWTLTPGDPVGRHKIRVFINETFIQEFEFDVVPD